VTTPCVLCGGERFEEYCPGILRCSGCTLVFADAELTDQEMLDLYGREYFFGEEYGDYLADRRVHEKNFRRRLATLEKFLDPSRRGSLLEIGSAYGFFLDLARERFDTVAGIDVNREGVEFARERLGLQATRGEFLEHDLEGRTFDVVCLWDVMEHLRSPHRYLEKISAHSRPGSLIALTTGDAKLHAGPAWCRPSADAPPPPRAGDRGLARKAGSRSCRECHCGVPAAWTTSLTVAASKKRCRTLPGDAESGLSH
jgi:SAM-dependent methyltransferase